MLDAGEPREQRELRVRIDAELHQKLHLLKLLRNKTMTDTIHEALVQYFAAVVPGGEKQRPEEPSPPMLRPSRDPPGLL